MPAVQRGAAWAQERLLGAVQQSVPQNGRVHLHIIEMCHLKESAFSGVLRFRVLFVSEEDRNAQQLTCKMVWPFSFYYLLFSFRLFELKEQSNFLILRKSPGGKTLKKCENMCEKKVPKHVKKKCRTILPFSCCPLVILWLFSSDYRRVFKTRDLELSILSLRDH